MAYTTIDNPELYFQTVLYTGNGSAGKAVTFDGDEDMQPDLVWIKQRDSRDHFLFNSVVGATKYLASNLTQTEQTDANTMTGFDSDGFTLGNGVGVNENTDGHVAWCWKESADSGFDIVSWSGTGSAQNVSHSLSAVPTMIIVKNRSAVVDWYVYNVHNGNTHSLTLNTTSAKAGPYSDNWNNTTPTSSVFTVGSSQSTGGSSGNNMIAYVFTDIQGYSKFGSYSSNSNADGPFVYLGFRPAWLMIKCTTATEHWTVFDNKKEPTNDGVMTQSNASGSSGEGTLNIHFLSNGFKILEVTGQTNKSGSHSYVYMAFAEQPFVNSNGVPCNAR